MSALTIDKEQLLSKVHNADSRSYLAEAIDCYGVGAYRGSVVLTACAVFEDLRFKLRDFAPFDKTAARVSKLVEEAFAQQKSYEGEVFEQLKGSNMLDPENKGFLLELLTARNRAAHASGLDTTQKKAAKFINEGVERILGRKQQWGEQGVVELLARMERIDLFPAIVKSPDFIADEELSNLDPRVYGKLIEGMSKAMGTGGTLYDKNARVILECFARRRDPVMRSYLFSKLINDMTLPASSTWIIDVLAEDPQILDCTAKNAIAADAALSQIILAAPDDELRCDQLETIFEGLISHQGEEELRHRYGETIKALSTRLWARPILTNGLARGDHVRDLVEESLLRKTREHDAAESLRAAIFSKWNPGEEKFFARFLSDASAFELIVNFCHAGDAGKDLCSKLINRGCAGVLDLRAKAVAFLRENDARASSILDSDEGGLSPEEFFDRYLKAESDWLISYDELAELAEEPIEAKHQSERFRAAPTGRGLRGYLRRVS